MEQEITQRNFEHLSKAQHETKWTKTFTWTREYRNIKWHEKNFLFFAILILEVYWFVDSDLIRCRSDTINLKLVTRKKRKLVEKKKNEKNFII